MTKPRFPTFGKYRKKPIVVTAMKHTRRNRRALLKWIGDVACSAAVGEEGQEYELQMIRIRTLEGTLYADIGDWIVKGIKGEFYPVKPDIFRRLYEAI